MASKDKLAKILEERALRHKKWEDDLLFRIMAEYLDTLGEPELIASDREEKEREKPETIDEQ